MPPPRPNHPRHMAAGTPRRHAPALPLPAHRAATGSAWPTLRRIPQIALMALRATGFACLYVGCFLTFRCYPPDRR